MQQNYLSLKVKIYVFILRIKSIRYKYFQFLYIILGIRLCLLRFVNKFFSYNNKLQLHRNKPRLMLNIKKVFNKKNVHKPLAFE